MNSKPLLIVMAALAALALGILLVGVVRFHRRPPAAPTPVSVEALTHIPEPENIEAHDYSAIVERNLFFPPETAKTVAAAAPAAPVSSEPVAKAAEFKMLAAYPDAWPRLKLTGVFLLGGKWGAVINGGNAVSSSQGTRFDSLYYEGDEIGGGVVLGAIARDSVVLVQDQQGWRIQLGAEPPVVVKKK